MNDPRRLRLVVTTLSTLLAAAAVMPAALSAADGDFLGSGGLAFDLGGTQADAGSAVAVQPDGKMVVAGTVATGASSWTLALARFLPDGSLDGSFGSAGRVINPFALGPNQTGTAILRVANGKLLVAGSLDYGSGDQDFYVGRLLDSGAADPSFGLWGTGRNGVAFDLGDDGTDSLAAMTLDRSGRILLAGSVDISATDIDFGVARFTPDGLLDNDFSGDGKQTVDIAGAADLALAITDSNSGIVVAGTTWSTALGGNFDIALARLTANGSLDGSFGTGGTVAWSFNGGGTNNDIAWALGVWPDGEIVVGADHAIGAGTWTWSLMRFAANGTLISDVLGNFCNPSPPCPGSRQESPRALLLQGDGKILMAGFGLGVAGNSDFGIARYSRDLVADTSFGGGDGALTYDFAHGIGADNDHGTALALDRDGRIVVAGSAEWNGLDTDFAWARFDSAYIFADDFEWPGGWSRWSVVVP